MASWLVRSSPDRSDPGSSPGTSKKFSHLESRGIISNLMIRTNFARYVSTPNGNMSSTRGNQLMNALRQLFPLASVRRWYISCKVCSYCSNLLDRNSAWSPSRNSKHALLWLNKDKIVSENSSALGMRKLIAAAMLNFKAPSFQTARALLTASSPGLLDLWNYKLDINFLFLRQSCEGKGKLYSTQI